MLSTWPHSFECCIILESKIVVMGIKEMITSSRFSWLLDKFSLQVPQKMYREQYMENLHTDVRV